METTQENWMAVLSDRASGGPYALLLLLWFGLAPALPAERCAAAGAQAPGANLIENGGFEQDARGWRLDVDADRRVRIVGSGARSGARALMLNGVGLDHEVDAESDPVPVRAGEWYRFEVWVRLTAGYGAYKDTIDWRDAQGRHIRYANDWTGQNRPLAYAAHGGRFQAPPGAAFAAIMLGISSGSACLMDDVSLTPVKPLGPQLAGYLFCEPPRRGKVVVRARIENHGNLPSPPVEAALTGAAAPVGRRRPLATARPVPALGAGEKTEVLWLLPASSLKAARALAVRVTSRSGARRRVGAPGVENATHRGASAPLLVVRARPFVTVGRIVPARGYAVPRPHPVDADCLIGAYYFPVMLDWEHYGWGVRRVDYLHPLLGYYDEALPEVADWHIKWAVEHGVRFFAYDWYFNDGSKFIQDALEKGFLKARYRSLMKFCVNWCNEGQCAWDRPVSFSTEALRKFIVYLCDHYLGRPEYLRVDGRPVVMIIRPDPIIEAHGGPDGSRKALQMMRAVARRYGHKGLYLVCIGAGNGAAYYKRAGYDAITEYAPGWGDAPRYANRDCEYEDLAPEHDKHWSSGLRDATAGGLPYIPVAWTGWDDTARAHEHAAHTRHITAACFRTMLQIADLSSRPMKMPPAPGSRPTAAPRMLLIEAWNEWGEGGHLEPGRETGFAMLDAVRDTFTHARGPHIDVVPNSEQVARYETHATFAEIERDYILRDRREHGLSMISPDWRFDKPGDLKGWHLSGNIAPRAASDGAWMGDSTNGDPQIYGPTLMEIPAAQFTAIEVELSATGGTMVQLFWRTDGMANFTEAASCAAPIITDGAFHTYRLPVGRNDAWRGTIRQLRLDPTDGDRVRFAVRSIRGLR
jgi:hypothetical protein